MLDRTVKGIIKDWIDTGKEACLVTGARQIGKTYLIGECLKNRAYHMLN